MTSVNLEELHADRFGEQVHTDFQVLDYLPVQFALRLVEVTERLNLPHQESFALLFRGPAQHFLPQGIHKLNHSRLGEIDLFLVPVGQDAEGFQYEAVFNHLI